MTEVPDKIIRQDLTKTVDTDNSRKDQYPTHGLLQLPCDILKVRRSSELLSYLKGSYLVETTATAATVGTLAAMPESAGIKKNSDRNSTFATRKLIDMKRYSFKAPTPFEFELKELSEITQVNRQISGVPHRTDFYQIVWIESGESVQTVDFSPVKVNGGQILFLTKNQVVSFDTSTSYHGQILLFTDTFFDRCDCDTRLIKQLHLFNPFTGNTPIAINENLKMLWAMMKDEFHQQNDVFQSNLIHNYLSAFLIQTERQCDTTVIAAKNQDYQTALQFAELVEQHYKRLRKVNDYIALMTVTAKPLSKALQTTVGKTPKQFIDDRILLEAKRLLVYSNETIKEITFLLGFDEPTNFSKFFREQTGLSPAEFKKQYTS